MWSRSKSRGKVHTFAGHSKVQCKLGCKTIPYCILMDLFTRLEVIKDTWYANAGSHVSFTSSKCFKCFICFQAITKVMLHPENSALVLTAAMDGIIKVNSLDFMEEIYRSDETPIKCTMY